MNGRRPLLSIVTVCKDHLEGLRRTLDSVLTQSFNDFEVIVVDGSSADGSRGYLQSKVAGDNRVRYISRRDTGIYHAMNDGAAMAGGEFLLFLNAGDVFASADILAFFVEQDDGSWDWGYGCARLVDASGRLEALLALVPFSERRLALGLGTIPHQATIMRLRKFEELGGFDERLGLSSDQDLLLRAAADAYPRVWLEFIADFEGGGLGSTQSPSAHARHMHAARRRRNRSRPTTAWGRTTLFELEGMATVAYRQLLFAQSAVRRCATACSVSSSEGRAVADD
jgi:glycosyltransferase involved in cell wall biosynthesis